MTELLIPASAIEAAKSAFAKTALTEKDHQFEKAMDAALRAAFEELGMEIRTIRTAFKDEDGNITVGYRYESRWMPVEES